MLSGDKRISILDFKSRKIIYEQLQEEESRFLVLLGLYRISLIVAYSCWLTDFN